VTSDRADSAQSLIARLEQLSRDHPQRVLRLRGVMPSAAGPAAEEPFELLIYRGFSSSTTHPTAFDPDQPVLPAALQALVAELLQGPLNPGAEQIVQGPLDPQACLDPVLWR